MLNLKKFPTLAMPGLMMRSVMVEGKRVLEITKGVSRTLWWPSPEGKWRFLGEEVLLDIPDPVDLPPVGLSQREIDAMFLPFDWEGAETRDLRGIRGEERMDAE